MTSWSTFLPTGCWGDVACAKAAAGVVKVGCAVWMLHVLTLVMQRATQLTEMLTLDGEVGPEAINVVTTRTPLAALVDLAS